jgi:Short C-terminal domain
MASPDGTVAGAPGAPAASTPPATPAPEDPLDRLERLNNLRLAGTLTDAEFEEQKKKILGEM